MSDSRDSSYCRTIKNGRGLKARVQRPKRFTRLTKHESRNTIRGTFLPVAAGCNSVRGAQNAIDKKKQLLQRKSLQIILTGQFSQLIPKPKHHTSEAGKKLPALTQMRLKIFFLVCNMLQLACVLVKLPALFALI